MQCSVPSPQTRSTAWMPTTVRVGKELGQDAQRAPVIRVVERRHQHGRVSDVEVGVAGREPHTVEVERRRHRQRDDPQRFSVGGRHRAETLEVVAQRFVVGVGPIGLLREHHRRLVDEARQIVDVPVGVVPGDAAAEPEHLARAEVGRQDPLELLARQPRVARLDVVQQALLRRQQRPRAVDVDGPPLQHHPPGLAGDGRGRLPLPVPKAARDAIGDRVVLLVVGVLRPAVESPVGDGHLPGAVLDEERAIVARPAPVGRRAEEVDHLEVRADAREQLARARLARRVVDQDAHPLAPRQVADHLAVDPGDRRQLARPVARLVRPGDPGGGVRLPLGGHDKPELSRRGLAAGALHSSIRRRVTSP